MANFDFVDSVQYGDITNEHDTIVGIFLPSITVAAGQLICCGFRWEGGGLNDATTISLDDDSFGLTFSEIYYKPSGGSDEDEKVAFVWAIANASGDLTITGTLSAAKQYRQGSANVFDLIDGATVDVVDVQYGNSPTDQVSPWTTTDVDALTGDLVVATRGNYNFGGQSTGSDNMTETAQNYLSTFLYNLRDSDGLFTPSGKYEDADSYAAIAVVFRISEGEITIDADIESIALTTFNSIISSNRLISAGVESITLGTFLAAFARTIVAGLEQIQLTPSPAAIHADIDTHIGAALESIVLETFGATISTTLQASAEQITLGTFIANIASNRSISATIETISVTTLPASLSLGSSISASLEEIAITPAKAAIAHNFEFSAGLEEIVLTEFAAHVELSTQLDATLVSLTVTPHGATLILDSGIHAHLESITLNALHAVITSSATPITAPGLEYTVNGQRLEFAVEGGRINYTLPLDRIHFTFEG